MLYTNTTTYDLELEGGSLKTVEDGSAEAITSKIQARLLTVVPEWFLNTAFGLDYRKYIWNKQTPVPVRNAHIQRQALLAAGTGSKIRSYEATVDTAARTLDVSIDVELPSGETATAELTTGV